MGIHHTRVATRSISLARVRHVSVRRRAALYWEGRLMLDELITGRYPLDRINEALESMARGEALRNMIVLAG